MPTIGLLYPGYSAEDDYAALESDDLHLPLVHSLMREDAHRLDALLDIGGPTVLATAATSLVARHRLDALMWACTSGSFVFGLDGAHEQVRALQTISGVPTSSTSLAFVEACRALRLRRVSVAATYPRDIAERLVEFLGRADIEVSAMGSQGIVTAAAVGRLGRAEVEAIVAGADTSGADAVLVPDTAMHTLDWIEHLEGVAGMPVLTANQVTVWEGLRLAGADPQLAGLGALFRTSGATR